ncbi:hypothetical protein V6N13_117554 [Hibiscus sabdariffa]
MGKFKLLCQICSLPLVLFLLPQVHCSRSLSSSSSLIPTPICVPDDTSALIQFRNAMSIHEPNVDFCDGTAHPKTDSWNETTNCCTWEGVTCDNATGQVIGLDLGCSMLAGSLAPDTSLSGLRGLKRLNLSYNDFKHSSIPLGFSRLVSLTHLDLSGSSFSGFVPPSNLSELQNLFLDSVDMFDVEPTSLVNLSLSLKHLSLPNCDLQGEFPSEIFQLRNLEYLDLSFNYLTGHLPKFNWSSPLSCELPSSLFNLTRLTYLELSSNRLTGLLPANVTGLQNLNELYLEDNLLTGGIPSWPFTLPCLQYLRLGHNSLTGPIDQIEEPNSIRVVYLENNDIHGEIPTSFFGLSGLIELDFSSNNLSGVIESDMLSKLENLEAVRLSCRQV